MEIAFEKYEGLGNDFILFDLLFDPTAVIPTPEAIQRLCDRRFGIGADGIICFTNADPEIANRFPNAEAVRMIYFNADGSRAETCFNGLRCIAMHAALTFPLLPREMPDLQAQIDGYPLIIQTDAGVIGAAVHPSEDLVRIVFPVTDSFDPIGSVRPVVVPTFDGFALSMGNPHFVVWSDEDDLKELNTMARGSGHSVETSPLFPHGTNFEIAHKVDNDHIIMAVWERGVGITLACGSGATAAVCSGVATSKLPADVPITVEMAGGKVTVTVLSHYFSESDGSATMLLVEGPAHHVFSGEFESDDFYGVQADA